MLLQLSSFADAPNARTRGTLQRLAQFETLKSDQSYDPTTTAVPTARLYRSCHPIRSLASAFGEQARAIRPPLIGRLAWENHLLVSLSCAGRLCAIALAGGVRSRRLSRLSKDPPLSLSPFLSANQTTGRRTKG